MAEEGRQTATDIEMSEKLEIDRDGWCTRTNAQKRIYELNTRVERKCSEFIINPQRTHTGVHTCVHTRMHTKHINS